MIINLSKDTIDEVRNPDLAAYARMYLHIYDDFMEQIAKTGIDIAEKDDEAEIKTLRERIKANGANTRNGGRSIYLQHISPACEACRKGIDSYTFFISLRCHRDCFYCFNPNQENYNLFTEKKRDVFAELEQIERSGQTLRHIALTGGEPLLFKEDTLRFFQTAQGKFPGAYTRLYTCGDHADRETLQALRAAGLQEIRFSLRSHDTEPAWRHTLDRIEEAREFIPYVMVEMPVVPESGPRMRSLLHRLDQLGIFGINLLEFCFPLNNAEAFNQRGYQVKKHPFETLYNYWYAGGLPVAGSELECLKLVDYALDKEMSLGVQYCSLENKHTGQIYQQNRGQDPPVTHYFSEKDFFLKSAKVFGEDMPPVRRALHRIRRAKYTRNSEHGYIEFHVRYITKLADLDVEIGVSSSVFERRQSGVYLRELKMEGTTPQSFDFRADV